MREKGQQRNRQAIPDLIAVLTEQPAVPTDLGLTAIHSLAQMGAEDALPTIDDHAASQRGPVALEFPNERVVNYIKVARARLVAEASVTDMKEEPQKTTTKVARLCQELSLSVADINKATGVNKVQQTPFNHPPTPIAVYAMREIADILYDSPLRDYKNIPIANGLDVASDYPTQLKMQLVKLSQADRINWLVNDLAHKKVVADNEGFEIQLAEDYGVSAGKVALTLPAQMDSHRDEYKSAGFDAMIRIVYGSGYQASQVQEHFLNDADPNVVNSAYVCISGTGIVGY